MGNHLIVGLGGTGGKIIRAFRKTLYQEYRSLDIDNVTIGYMYVDSSKNLMGETDPTWKILGANVQLGKESQVLISGANLNEYLNSIDRFPGIKPWIGDKSYWTEILNSIQDDAAGGQKRRLGRFLFACGNKLFHESLNKQVKSLVDKSSLTDVTFHICTGLAGGTGSGTLIDVINQIRERYPATNARPYKIILYLLLPDINPPFGWDTGNYHANGYACLSELNSLSVGSFHPYDITGTKGQLSPINPFNGCYVFTNQNENGLEIDVDKEVPIVMADYLYQKIVTVKDINWESLSRLENAENGDNTPETSPKSSKGERSKRFLSFGIKRLSFPEEEIKEYLTYNYIRQSVLQLIYNNWTEEFGYSEESKNQDYSEEVKTKEINYDWLMSDEHLTLSIGILPEDIKNKRWRPINSLWESLIPNFIDTVKSGANKNWLEELQKYCEKQFSEDYRGSGVVQFYNNKSKYKKEISKEVRNKIERDIFNRWKTGSKGLYEINKLLSSYIEFISTERKNIITDKIVKLQELEDSKSAEVEGLKKEWSQIGFIREILGKKEKLLTDFGLQNQLLYSYRTYREGYKFASSLMEDIIFELNDLKSEISKTLNRLIETSTIVKTKINERCNDGKKVDMKSQVIKFYDSEHIKNINNNLIRNDQEQKSQTNKIRVLLSTRIGENQTFKMFNERIDKSSLWDLLEITCEENAKTAHNTIIESKRDKILGVNILDKIIEKYDGNEAELKLFISELVKSAGNYVSFDPYEIAKRGPGIPESETLRSTFTVILPKSTEHNIFIDKLKNYFQQSTSHPVEFIQTEQKKNQITLISIKNLFPIRYISQVSQLKEKYLQRICKVDNEKAKFILHIEGDGTQHPPIFVMTKDEELELERLLKESSMPYLLIAHEIDLIKELEDPGTGLKEFMFMRKKKSGLDDAPIAMGNKFIDTYKYVTSEEILNSIKENVNRKLEEEYRHISRKSVIKEGIIKNILNIKTELNGNIRDPVYIKYNNAGDVAIEQILKYSN